jgi:hypothetical protein
MKNQTNSWLAVLSGLSFMALTAGAMNTAVASPAMMEKSAPSGEQKMDVSSIHGSVSEIITASGYTYVAIDVDGKKVWAAGPISSFKIGDHVGFSMEMPIANFQSRSLERTFDRIYFVDGFITKDGVLSEKSSKMSLSHGSNALPHGEAKAASGKVTVKITKVKGGKDIAEIYKEKDSLSGKPVTVKGEVTKYTPNILGFNWIHIRDGSTDSDLTITTSDTVAVGDVIVVKGLIALEKDFGYGYVYPVILEEAKVVTE